jgi:hypothetical protein
MALGGILSGLTVEQEILARPSHLTVFVSSKMSGGTLTRERLAAARAAEGVDVVRAWYWERDANAGPVSALPLCVNQAAASEVLFLILEDELTPVTYKEYLAAKRNGAWCCILIKDGGILTDKAQRFVDRESKHAVYKRFRTLSELRSHVVNAIYASLTREFRFGMARRRVELATRGRRK